MRIRPAEDDDLLACARIFARSARDLTERYRVVLADPAVLEPDGRLPILRHLRSTGSVIVAEDPDPVGFSAAIVRDGVWFLSQLWVLPERHGEGIGRALLDEALAGGQGATTFAVVASPHPAAQRLYLRASMFPLWIQQDMDGRDAPVPRMPDGFGPLTDADQAWVDDLDREIRGTARPEDHAFFRSAATGVALRRDGEPRGYVYASADSKIGPGAARDRGDIPTLLRAGRHLAGGSAMVAVPSNNWAALKALAAVGFSPGGSSTFMASRPLGDGSRYLSSGGALG